MRSECLMENTWISITTTPPADTWTLPQTMTADCASHMCAGLLAVMDSFSGGTITLNLQTSVIESLSSNAWTTIATTTFTSATSKTLWVNASAALPPLGKLRVQAVCTGSNTSFTLRLELLQKAQVEFTLQEWMPAVYLNFAGASNQTMPADQWSDIGRFLNVFALLEFNGSSGANLTVKLQTAPFASSDDTAWLDVDSKAMSVDCQTLAGGLASTYPPMGALRLYFSASGACSGTLKATLIAKET